MRKIKEVLRLHAECRLAGRAIARSLAIGPATVYDYLARARLAKFFIRQTSSLTYRTRCCK